MIKQLIRKIETSLTVRSKVLIALTLGVTLAGLLTVVLAPTTDPVYNTVMITNLTGTSGGSGVVISSSDTSSLVLTNAHVCGLVEVHGGIVKNNKHSFNVLATKSSNNHDICLLKAGGDFETNTSIASRAPVQFYEKAIVSGHPALYPTTVTSGHFSGIQNIMLITGFRQCTAKDLEDYGVICVILGGKIPLIRQYPAMLVTATIMGGSSGCVVYNESGEVSGLVFAGQGSFGYALTVPYVAVKDFIDVEQYTLDFKTVSQYVDLKALLQKDKADSDDHRALKDYCKGRTESEIFCETATDSLWRK
jgi:hypothetical protein